MKNLVFEMKKKIMLVRINSRLKTYNHKLLKIKHTAKNKQKHKTSITDGKT